MALVLKRMGYEVVTMESGFEAIDLLRQRSFDVVFMDIKLPVMNGVETYKVIKTIRPEAVVLMMTAYALEDLVQEALKEGAYDVVYKPLDMNAVLTTIVRAQKAGQGAFILVVDDHRETCTTFKNILTKKGYSVGTAFSGEEAITRAKEQVYDILFLDMKLPTINGLETYLKIKEIDPDGVAILMTGYRYEMETLVEEAMENSAYACLFKPLDMEAVLRLIGEILRRKQRM